MRRRGENTANVYREGRSMAEHGFWDDEVIILIILALYHQLNSEAANRRLSEG